MIETKTETQSTPHIRFRQWIALAFAMNAWLLLLLLAPAAFGMGGYPPHLDGAVVEKYKTVGDVSLDLWIFNPKNHKPSDHSAAILFFFGGGWNAGSPEQLQSQCQHLAEHGMVTITVDYRVNSREPLRVGRLRWCQPRLLQFQQREHRGHGQAHGPIPEIARVSGQLIHIQFSAPEPAHAPGVEQGVTFCHSHQKECFIRKAGKQEI